MVVPLLLPATPFAAEDVVETNFFALKGFSLAAKSFFSAASLACYSLTLVDSIPNKQNVPSVFFKRRPGYQVASRWSSLSVLAFSPRRRRRTLKRAWCSVCMCVFKAQRDFVGGRKTLFVCSAPRRCKPFALRRQRSLFLLPM